MTAVSLQSKLRNHHPEWSNVSIRVGSLPDSNHRLTTPLQVYNTTFIRWTTHNPAGLSEKDVTLAALCDALAKDMGDNILITDATKSEVRRLVDQVCVRTKVSGA